MNDGLPPPIAITAVPQLIPAFGLKQSSAFSHGDIYIFDITANATNLIVSASNHEIKLYNPTTMAINRVLRYHTEPISQIKAHGENFVMSASKDGQVAVWDLRTEATSPVQVFTTPTKDPLLSFDLNSSEQILAAGTELIEYDAKIHFFDARSNTSNIINTFVESHSDDVTQIRFHPSTPSRLLSGSVDGLLCQYDLTDMDEDEALLAVANTGASINKAGYFGPGSEYMYCLSHMETLSLWTSEEADLIHNFGDIRGVTNPSLGLTLDYGIDCQYEPTSQRLFLLSGSNEGNINILHVNSNSLQLCQVMQGGHSEIVRSTYWNPQRGILYSGGEDAKLGLWSTNLLNVGEALPTAQSSARMGSPLQMKSGEPKARKSPY